MKKLLKEFSLYFIFILITIVFSILIISISYYNSKNTINEDISKLNLFNVETLIIVAHPSDETIWSSNNLIEENCLVVCISCQNNQETKEFIKIIRKTNDLYLTLEYKEFINDNRTNWNTYHKELTKEISSIIKAKNWTKIITHNPEGEYGNKHHKLISNIVTENTNNKDILYYFQKYYSHTNISNYQDYLLKLPETKIQNKYKLLSIYNSKDYIIDSYAHIIPYEEIISSRKWGELYEKTK